MQLRCCLIDITIIIWRHILYLVYLCPYQRLVLFMSYLLGLFFIFSLIFFDINHIFSFKQTYLFFAHIQNISYYLWMINWLKKPHSFLIAKVQPQRVVQLLLNFFFQFQPGISFKSVVCKSSVYLSKQTYVIDILQLCKLQPRTLMSLL